jgi:hypothetical protein
MLAQSVKSIYKELTEGDNRYTTVPRWMQYLKKGTLNAAEEKHKLQFLGLVLLYQTKTGSRVCAFHIHSFVLYRFLEDGLQTRVNLLLCQSELIHSSVQERLLQILQLMQSEFRKSSALIISPEVDCDDVAQAYQYMGFEISQMKKSNRTIFARKSIIKLSTFTNRIMWAQYGNYLTLPEVAEDRVHAAKNIMCRLLGELLVRPLDPATCIAMRFHTRSLEQIITRTLTFNGPH